MSFFSDAIQTIVKGVGDVAGGILKVQYGTPGTQIRHPAAPTTPYRLLNSGQMWLGNSLFKMVFDALGLEHDKQHGIYAVIATSAAGVVPVVTSGPRVLSVTKNEVAETLTVNFVAASAFSSANFGVSPVLLGSTIGHQEVVSQTATSVVIRFQTAGLVFLDINDRNVSLICMGQA